VDHGHRERNEPNMHLWCTHAAPPGSTAVVDRRHGEAHGVTVVGQWTGQEASALRQALRMTIRDFADHLSVADRTVAKWEAGGSAMVPVPVMQAALDTVLARAPDEAKGRFGILLGATRDPAEIPGSAVTLGAAALAGRAPVPRRLNPEAIRRLRTILMEYVKIDNLLGPAHLLDLVALHLNFIGELLTLASGRVRVELLTVGAWYAEFAGWLYQDAGNPRVATYWTDRALSWVQAADDPLRVSYVLMRKSNQASGLGDAGRTLDLARAALRGEDRLAPRVRALALRQEARGHALSGDPTACARALDAALEQAAAAPGDHGDDDRALAGYCTPSYIDGEAADCWMLLGQPRKAVAILEHGLAAWPAPYQRDRGLNLARLAVAHATDREPEQACAVAQEAAGIVSNTWSARATAELRRLPTLLAAWPDLAPVVELRETLAALP
jgi:DNA-binding transcriptional regulator YiaG/tetratricopeptide (TPR) repeat protein